MKKKTEARTNDQMLLNNNFFGLLILMWEDKKVQANDQMLLYKIVWILNDIRVHANDQKVFVLQVVWILKDIIGILII